MVKVAKKFMEKSTIEGKPWNYGLLEYRRTPLSSKLPSPLELLMSRRPRSRLPQLASTVCSPMLPMIQQYRNELQVRQDSKNPNSTRIEDTVEKLETGQLVWVKDHNHKGYSPGIVHSKADEPHSYWINIQGSVVRRTSSHLKPRLEQTKLELLQSQQEMFGNFQSVPQPANFDRINTKSGAMPPATPQKLTVSPAAPNVSVPPTTMPTPVRRSSHSNKGVPPIRFTPK